MSDLPSRASACQLLGCADSELLAILDSPAGVVYQMSDGNSYIDVPADKPDFEGKTGLMFVAKPHVANDYGYVGDFPVFANPPVEVTAEAVARDIADADAHEPTKEELLAQARDLGIDADGRWSAKRLVEAIAAAHAATESSPES